MLIFLFSGGQYIEQLRRSEISVVAMNGESVRQSPVGVKPIQGLAGLYRIVSRLQRLIQQCAITFATDISPLKGLEDDYFLGEALLSEPRKGMAALKKVLKMQSVVQRLNERDA